jgi:peptidoglycan/xylan/chitin deacetylase (PgdA/CDA1 family)
MLSAAWLKHYAKRTLAPLARFATRRCARIVMYHRFGPGDTGRRLEAESLDRQLRFLKRHFNVVPLRQLVERLKADDRPEPGMVALTVDDAYSDFGEHAYPVFRDHGIPVTLYVITEFAGGAFWLWWDAIRYLVREAATGRYRVLSRGIELEVSLTDAESREKAWLTFAGIGVALTPAERDEYLFGLQNALAVRLPGRPTLEFSALTWDELRCLDPEIVEIGAHTRTHPILSRCDSTRIHDEVAGSKAAIERQIGRPVSAFCYPNGELADVDERCMAAVQDAGFDSAVMACGDLVSSRANLYALERMSASHDRSEFEGDVSGISYVYRRLRRRSEQSP